MTIALINPQDFQGLALEWIGVATIILGAVAGFVGALLGYIAKLKSEAALRQGDSDHAVSTANISALQTAVTDIALKTPSHGQSGAPMPVTVTNPPEKPVNVTEQP